MSDPHHRRYASLVARGLAFLAIALLLLAGCQTQDPFLDRVTAAGVLRVGLDPSWPPFEYIEGDEIVGLDVDLAHAIGKELGVDVVLVPSGWEGLYGALLAGQFDAVISALPYDPWRTKEALYSTSYFNAGPVLVVSETQTDVASAKDLKGRTVHVELGSEGDVQARRLQKQMPEIAIESHDTAQDALHATLDDPESAAIVDHVTARLLIRETPGLRITGKPLYDESYVIAVHPQASSLQQAIDRILIEMRESGQLDQLLNRWL
jgi:polar amino acid transport system substrate-binding protein